MGPARSVGREEAPLKTRGLLGGKAPSRVIFFPNPFEAKYPCDFLSLLSEVTAA